MGEGESAKAQLEAVADFYRSVCPDAVLRSQPGDHLPDSARTGTAGEFARAERGNRPGNRRAGGIGYEEKLNHGAPTAGGMRSG